MTFLETEDDQANPIVIRISDIQNVAFLLQSNNWTIKITLYNSVTYVEYFEEEEEMKGRQRYSKIKGIIGADE
jgi:hypothetical protein